MLAKDHFSRTPQFAFIHIPSVVENESHTKKTDGWLLVTRERANVRERKKRERDCDARCNDHEEDEDDVEMRGRVYVCVQFLFGCMKGSKHTGAIDARMFKTGK